jgi:uncharacterized MAPEG superfamily protein
LCFIPIQEKKKLQRVLFQGFFFSTLITEQATVPFHFHPLNSVWSFSSFVASAMGFREAAKVLVGCLAAYVVNIVGNLFLHRSGVLDGLWRSLVSLCGASQLVIDKPHIIPIVTLLYLIFLWMFSHLIAIVLGGWVTEEEKDKKWSNKEPRRNPQLFIAGSLQSRLYSSHLNAGEQFSFTAAALILSIVLKVDSTAINACCAGLVLFRTLFHICYALDFDLARSLFYELAFGNMILLFLRAM